MNKENKKAALFYIYQILMDESSYSHPLTHTEISSLLEERYGIVLERKAVGRDIAVLQDAGVMIEVTKKGSFITEKAISDQELTLICDALQTSSRLTPARSEDLISKVSQMGSAQFSTPNIPCFNLDNVRTEENFSIVYTLERISNAITDGTQVSFDISRYGMNKRLHRYASVTVSPYEIIIHDSRYYLLCFDDGKNDVMFYDLSRVTDVRNTNVHAKPVKSIPYFRNGIDHSIIGHDDRDLFVDIPSVHEIVFPKEQLDDYLSRLVGYPGVNVTEQNDGQIKMTVRIGDRTLSYILRGLT